MSDLPTTKDELERKTVETLIDTEHRHSKGLLTNREVGLIGYALWSTTAGLVDSETSELCGRMAVDRFNPLKRHFIGKGHALSIVWDTFKPGFILVRRDAINPDAPPQVIKRSSADVGEREGEIERLQAGLLAAGYKQL